MDNEEQKLIDSVYNIIKTRVDMLFKEVEFLSELLVYIEDKKVKK